MAGSAIAAVLVFGKCHEPSATTEKRMVLRSQRADGVSISRQREQPPSLDSLAVRRLGAFC
jgi:hypothetical protein